MHLLHGPEHLRLADGLRGRAGVAHRGRGAAAELPPLHPLPRQRGHHGGQVQLPVQNPRHGQLPGNDHCGVVDRQDAVHIRDTLAEVSFCFFNIISL